MTWREYRNGVAYPQTPYEDTPPVGADSLGISGYAWCDDSGRAHLYYDTSRHYVFGAEAVEQLYEMLTDGAADEWLGDVYVRVTDGMQCDLSAESPPWNHRPSDTYTLNPNSVTEWLTEVDRYDVV